MKVCGVKGNIEELFSIMKLNKMFDVQKDEKTAVESYKTPSVGKWFGFG